MKITDIKDVRPSKLGRGHWYICRFTKSGKIYLLQSASTLVFYNDKHNGMFNNFRSQAIRKLTDAEMEQLNLKTNMGD